MIKNI
jgi:hypothetical protein